MKKFSEEQEEYFRMCIEEAERDIEENGTLSEEEFWSLMEEDGSEEIYKKRSIRKNNIQLNLLKCFGNISKKFVKI